MTKAIIGEEPVEVNVQRIPLDLLDASPRNPRCTMDERELGELAASIKNSGVTQPLIVRPVTWVDGLFEPRYEIVCGHRRSEAANLAGLEDVPCIVRELSDLEAAEMALVDNLQRVDVPALEEAEAFGALLDTQGTIEAVAARVGKEVSHVAKRLKLRALGVWPRHALGANLITIDHTLVLARLGVAEQDEALKWSLDHNAGVKTPVDKVITERIAWRKEEAKKKREGRWHQTWEPATVQALKDYIASETGILLSRAPWSLDATDLVQGDACNACPQNTKANVPLFGDLLPGEPTCTDSGCFKRKTEAFVAIAVNSAKEGQKLPLRVSWKATSTAPRMNNGSWPSLTQIFKAGQWLEAKKNSCEHVRAGVTVDWPDANNRGNMGDRMKLRKPGEIIQVCVAPKCKAHEKAYENEDAGSAAHRNENSAEARAEREAWEKAVESENAMRATVIKTELAKVEKLSGNLLRRIALRALSDWHNPEDEEHFPGIEKGLKSLKVDSPEFARAAASTLFIGADSCEIWLHKWNQDKIDTGRKELIALLKDIGYDASKAWIKKPEDEPVEKKARAKKAVKKQAKKPRR